MVPLWRGIGGGLVAWGVLIIAWSLALTQSEDWDGEIQPGHAALAACLGVGTAVLGGWAFGRTSPRYAAAGLATGAAGFLAVLRIVGGT